MSIQQSSGNTELRSSNASTATLATTATNLAGGSGGTVPYQSSAGVTAMLANGTAGQVLTSSGTTVAPTWTTISAGGLTWGTSVAAGSGVALTLTSADLGGGNAFQSSTHTASGTLTSNTTTQNTYSTSRTATGGTASDNFIGTLFSRTNVTNGANLTSAGSVVKITGTDTQTANTLTPTYDLLALAPSLRSTGSSLSVTVANSVVTAPTNGHIYAVLGNTNTVAQTLMQLDGGTSGGQHVNLRVIRTGSGGVGGAGICLNQFSGATQATGSDHASFIYGSQFNTNSGVSTTGFYLTNQQNTGAGYNTAIAIYNYSTDFQTASNGSGLLLSQNGVGGNALQVYGANNVNSSTNGLVNYTLSNTQSGATVMQKIDTGTSAQGHTGLLVNAYNASASLKGIHIDHSSTAAGSSIYFTYTGSNSLNCLDFRGVTGAATLLNAVGVVPAGNTPVDIINVTQTSTANANISWNNNRIELTHSLRAAGTRTDATNMFTFKRTSVTEVSASANLTASGSVLKIENVATQTTGTLTDTVAVLSLVQDNDSTGGHILFNTYTGVPLVDGTLYFDGTNFKYRAGGATKTITAV